MKTAQQVVLAYVDAFNRGDVDGVCSPFTSDAVVWGVTGWGSPDEARPVWKDLMEALQIQLTVDAMVVQGETVVVRYTERGTSVRAFRGLGPTNRS
jgi:ketosteroid isomerase-like protein